MKTWLYRCGTCGRYTMECGCPACGEEALPRIPPRYSPEDRWGKYRRLLLMNLRE